VQVDWLISADMRRAEPKTPILVLLSIYLFAVRKPPRRSPPSDLHYENKVLLQL
jgi:hypothetical protein